MFNSHTCCLHTTVYQQCLFPSCMKHHAPAPIHSAHDHTDRHHLIHSVESSLALPQIILMAGLQGVGKTTACGKLALFLKKQKKRVLMVATDVYRPAAIEQLVKLGERISVPVFQQGTDAKPQDIAAAGLKHVSMP